MLQNLNSSGPVSYTHLDVYKRQTQVIDQTNRKTTKKGKNRNHRRIKTIEGSERIHTTK